MCDFFVIQVLLWTDKYFYRTNVIRKFWFTVTRLIEKVIGWKKSAVGCKKCGQCCLELYVVYFLLIGNSLMRWGPAAISHRKNNCTAFKCLILKAPSTTCQRIGFIGRCLYIFPFNGLVFSRRVPMPRYKFITAYHVLQHNKSTRIKSDNVFSSCLLSFRLKGQSSEITYHYTLDTHSRISLATNWESKILREIIN